VEVYIEINTGQARLVESMLISLREHLFVFFQKMDKQEKLVSKISLPEYNNSLAACVA
jgi:hypothetical protein